jgi:hypothetical protein
MKKPFEGALMLQNASTMKVLAVIIPTTGANIAYKTL